MLSSTLKNGYGFTLSHADYPNLFLSIDPTELTPPGIDGGDATDITTQSNTNVRTKEPRSLKEITDGSLTVAYDPAVLSDLMNAVNDNGLLTLTFPDGSSWAFYGYFKDFSPGAMNEEDMPTADITVVVTNVDNDGGEQVPVYTGPSA